MQDEDRCQIYEKHGSRRTRCTRPREGVYVVDDEDVVLCFMHWAYEPEKLDALCREAIKMKPKKEKEDELV